MRNGLAHLQTVDTGMLRLEGSAAVHLTGFSVLIKLVEEQIQRDEGLETSGSNLIWTLKKAFDKLHKRPFRRLPPSS